MSEVARLAAFVDVLLPGEDPFPSASAAGVPERLIERLGGETVRALHTALPGTLDEANVAELERAQPALFATLYRAACLIYYATPDVVAAIRATGVDWRSPLQPRGHTLDPFDPGTDTPRHGRGHFVATEDVRPVALPNGLRR